MLLSSPESSLTPLEVVVDCVFWVGAALKGGAKILVSQYREILGFFSAQG